MSPPEDSAILGNGNDPKRYFIFCQYCLLVVLVLRRLCFMRDITETALT
jgi:hypothetical protein